MENSLTKYNELVEAGNINPMESVDFIRKRNNINMLFNTFSNITQLCTKLKVKKLAIEIIKSQPYISEAMAIELAAQECS